MNLLAFDTSTHWLTVGCRRGDAWHERAEPAGHAHSERLLPLIDAVLGHAGLALSDLDAIAFGAGPGSFTGVRIACGVAQGLALGAGVPLVPVSTLEALAQRAWTLHGVARVLACLDARMREVYVAAYERRDDAWHAIAAPAVVPPDAVVPPAGEGWFGAGDGLAVYADLPRTLGLAGHDAAIAPDARAIAELAAPRFVAGETVTAAHALPIYVRHRVALTTAERASGLRLPTGGD